MKENDNDTIRQDISTCCDCRNSYINNHCNVFIKHKKLSNKKAICDKDEESEEADVEEG